MLVWNVLQRALPHHAISRLVGRVAASRRPWLKNRLNRWFTRAYGLDLSDAEHDDPTVYASFNALFTRALRPGARPECAEPLALGCPVDGTVSECGPLDDDRLVQAKGRRYSLRALLGDDALAAPYRGGHFMTLYLAPFNYHRIHMPAGGRPTHMTLVPGRLFSVNTATAAGIDNLFARNERVVCHFDGDYGLFCLVLVGALNVGSIATTWHGTVTPPAGRSIRHWRYGNSETLARGAEMGRFNLGSTVIVLTPPGRCLLVNDGANDVGPGRPVRVGQALGQWRATSC